MSQVGNFIDEALSQPRFVPLVERLKGTVQDLTKANRTTIRVGSMCSGWGTQEMVSESFASTWNATFPGMGIDATSQLSLLFFS